MIDWSLAERVAAAIADRVPAADARGVAAEVDDYAARSARLVSSYTGLVAADGLPDAETVDRSGWTTTNLGSMRVIMDPIADRAGGGLGPASSVLRTVTGMLLAVEVGALSGMLASRVLGQYEFPLLDAEAPARLLFVGPNLAGAARALKADEGALVRWVALHETTHALQFGGVPWLREHLATRVKGLVASLDVQIDLRRALRVPKLDDVRGLVRAVREGGGFVTVVAGPERRALLDEMQATMALLEGYAEHVMDAVGLDELPELPELRAGLERRRRSRSGFLRVFERLIGLDMKLRQYEQGKRFCDEVVAQAGISGLNRAWSEPSALPTLAELDAPRAWLQRVSSL
ncbi:MAG: hypothetical protein QOF76_5139 [Solirubrobacteraceae bacterium]|jgi:coenzyme F420 biosynthesis associated uncharacterized protein|nr:hypothetical protein [Solirubrobacteraceae bacterium]